MQYIWAFYAFLSAIFAAVIPIISKKAFNDLNSLDSTMVTTVRSIFMSLFLVVVSIATNKIKLLHLITPKAYFYIVCTGLAGALSWLCYFLAIKIAPQSFVTSVAAIDKLSVVFVVIFAALLLGEKFTINSISGAILITFGALLMTIK